MVVKRFNLTAVQNVTRITLWVNGLAPGRRALLPDGGGAAGSSAEAAPWGGFRDDGAAVASTEFPHEGRGPRGGGWVGGTPAGGVAFA